MNFIKEKIYVTCEDNIDLMKRFNENETDVAFIDPEYGIGESSKNHKSRNTPIVQKNGKKLKAKDSVYLKKEWDNKPPDDLFFKEIKRVSKNQVIFGANYFPQIINEPCKPPRRNEYNQFLKKNPRGFIIWDKVNGSNDFNDCEIIYTSYDFDSFIVYYMWNGMMQGVEVSTDLQKAIIQIGDKTKNEKRLHPTQKPLKLIRWLFNFLNLFGLKIIDTNAGLMGTVIVSIEADCEIYACDNDAQYYELGINRIKNHLSQKSLF